MKNVMMIVGIGSAFLMIWAGNASGAMNGFGGGGGGGGGMGPGPGDGGGTAQSYDSTFTSTHFSGSGNCKTCHNGLVDAYGTDVSIETHWSSTTMAHAGRDPVWRAKVSSELARNPQLASVINKKCSRCHTPMANTEAEYSGDAPDILKDLRNPANKYYSMAADGVSCTLCHQIADTPELGTDAGYSGHYTVETFANSVDRRIYGQYDNVFAMPMRNNVNYTISYSPHIKESELCATCHNLYTPYVDGEGNIISTPETEFPEQVPYSEWLASDYVNVASCQDCHMPRTDGVVMASRPMWLDTARDGFATHKLIGGNILLLDMLQNNQAELGATTGNISQTIQETRQMLQSAASIDLAAGSLADNILEFTLRVSSATGHKLPTGIPFRRIVLHVTVTDRKGNTVFESGRINGNGSVVGIDSDVDQALYEPHHELIDSEDQVQVYETVMHNDLGKVTYTLLRASGMLKDNRIPPAGFRKFLVSDDIGVVGNALVDDNFTGGGDEVTFRVSGLPGSRYTVRAELVYQAVSYAFLQDLSRDATAEIGALTAMYNSSSAKAVTMTSGVYSITR